MEPSRFDELTKALATATSRRQALKAIAATALGSVLGLAGIGTAFANCKPNGIGCNIGSQCCSGACCKGTCTDLNNDVHNCGKCGHACASGQTCQNGQCVAICPPSPACNDTCPCDASQCQTCQGGTCVSSCDACSTCQGGTCVSSCSSGQVCLSNGTCATPCTTPCSNGSSSCSCGDCLCDRNFCGTNESGFFCDTGSDNQCPKGTFCDDGVCFIAC